MTVFFLRLQYFISKYEVHQYLSAKNAINATKVSISDNITNLQLKQFVLHEYKLVTLLLFELNYFLQPKSIESW